MNELFPDRIDETADVLAHADDAFARDDKWHKTLAEYVDVLTAALRRRGRNETEALADAIDCIAALGQYCGGRQRYLPTGERLRLGLRDRRIWKEWRGNNEAELMAQYQLTQRRLQQILAEQRAIHVRKFQGNLFD